MANDDNIIRLWIVQMFENLLGTIFLSSIFSSLIGLTAALSAPLLEAIINLIPAWLSKGLGVAGNMLPAVGFAMILNMMAASLVTGEERPEWDDMIDGMSATAVLELENRETVPVIPVAALAEQDHIILFLRPAK